ncbi:hypothetical protein QBC44DRAFT_81105 [Cladorrhinum sp. PSN332]|nr:hypothetical protein QBC44DRAFT_81105 [Cladorrhinum sp. PSN332]
MARAFTRTLSLIWVLILLLTTAGRVVAAAAFVEPQVAGGGRLGGKKPPVPEPGPDQPWPHYDVVAAYNKVNNTRLRDAVQCLRNFCETKTRLQADGGKARCYTKHGDGKDVAAWVCNMSPISQVCSAQIVNSVLKKQVPGTAAQGAVDSTGVTWYSASSDHHLLFGFDKFCGGGTDCDKYKDTVHFCDDVLDTWRKQRKRRFREGDIVPGWSNRMRSPVQFEDWTNGYETKGHRGTVIKNRPEEKEKEVEGEGDLYKTVGVVIEEGKNAGVVEKNKPAGKVVEA